MPLACQAQGDGANFLGLRLGGDWVLRPPLRTCIGPALLGEGNGEVGQGERVLKQRRRHACSLLPSPTPRFLE